MQRSAFFPSPIPHTVPPSYPWPLPPYSVHADIHFSIWSPLPVTSEQVGNGCNTAGRQVELESILHRGPSEHDASHRKSWFGFCLYTRDTAAVPHFLLVAPKSQHSNAGIWSFEKKKKSSVFTIMTQDVRVCAEARSWEENMFGVLEYTHTLSVCMFVHLLTCIKAMKTRIRFLFQAAFFKKWK